ncbi:hypothetical protein [Streptomyces sp. NPDC002209]|uniref:hypothetical protein n=1 Tax=Streptomyces sp. NPDC002209 TaxID=3364638 RepID=UPI0036B8B560
MAFRDTIGRACLTWREYSDEWGWKWEPIPLTRGPWTCNPLAAPSLTTHNGRLYAIYHA